MTTVNEDFMVKGFQNFRLLISPLAAFFAGTALVCCAYALLSSSLGIRLSKNGVSTANVGMVMALYYAGSVWASMTAHKIINKVGHVRSFTACLPIFSALTLFHYFSGNIIFWGILRLLEGYCIGAATMCLESWLNSRSTNKNRGIIMSLYMVTTYVGAGIGQILLNIPDNGGVTIYILVSVMFSFSLVPISLTALPTPEITAHKSMSLVELYKKTPVGVLGCIVSGCFVGSFYTLGPVFASSIGLSIHNTSIFMFAAIFGGMSAQIPVGKISDRMDRRLVMMGICVLMFFVAPMFYFLSEGGMVFIAIGAALIGFCTFVIYPIGVSHVNDLITDAERVQASGKLVLLQGIGFVIGPVVIGWVMQHFGGYSYLLCYAALASAFVMFTVRYLYGKPKINYINVTPTDPMPVEVTSAFIELAKEDTFIDRIKKSKRRKDKMG